MSNIETFSTIFKDGEDLAKINTWLNRFRCGEVVRFHVQRVTTDSTRILIEAQDHKRLRIVSSNPPHQSYLQTTKTVPYIYVHFSEPISLETFYGEVTLNETAVSNDALSVLDDNYTLRVSTTGFTVTTAGQYELIFGTGVRHYNKIWPLYGERKVIWYTSEHGGSRGGVEIRDPEKCILNIARISIEGQHSEERMLTEFYNTYGVDPDEVELTALTSGYPEHDRTTLWVIYCLCWIPYVKCTNPQYKACFFQDGAPDEVTVEIGFTRSVLEESLENEIEVDGVTIANDKWELTQDGKLLTVKFTPAQYKHHEVKIATMKSGEFLRTWPYYFSFVIHSAGDGAPTDAQYLVAASHADLSAERAIANSTTTQWNTSTPGSISVDVIGEPRFVLKTSDQTNIGSSFENVSGLEFSIAANTTYSFHFYIRATADALTTGVDVAVNGPTGKDFISYTKAIWGGPNAINHRGGVDYDEDSAPLASNGTDLRIFEVSGIIKNGSTAGTLYARIKREAAGTGAEALQGSWGKIIKLS